MNHSRVIYTLLFAGVIGLMISCKSSRSKLMYSYSGLWVVDSIYVERNVERSFKLNTLMLEEDGTCSTPIRIERYNFNSLGKWTVFNEDREPMIELYDCTDEQFNGEYQVEFRKDNKGDLILNLTSRNLALFCNRSPEIYENN